MENGIVMLASYGRLPTTQLNKRAKYMSSSVVSMSKFESEQLGVPRPVIVEFLRQINHVIATATLIRSSSFYHNVKRKAMTCLQLD